MFISKVGTHIQSLFISPDNSSAKQLGLHHIHQSCTSTHTLSLILKMKQSHGRCRYIMFISQVHTHTHTISF